MMAPYLGTDQRVTIAMDGRVPTLTQFRRGGHKLIQRECGKQVWSIGYSGEDDAWWVWFKGGREHVVDLAKANLDIGCNIRLDGTEYTVTEHWFVRNSKKGTVWLTIK